MTADPVWSLFAPLTAPDALVWADQNAAPPPKPYTAVFVRTVDPLGTMLTGPDDAGDIRVSEPVLLRVELNFYGRNAMARARATALRLRLPSTVALSRTLNLGVVRVLPIVNATAFVDEPQYEERALLEVAVNATDGAGSGPTGGQFPSVPAVNVGIVDHVVITPDTGAVLSDGVMTCGGTASSPTASTPPP